MSSMSFLKELPIVTLRTPNGVTIEGYKGQFALGRFKGRLFIVRHAWSEDAQCFVPEVFASRAAADRAAIVSRTEDGLNYTSLPVETAFGAIAAKQGEAA